MTRQDELEVATEIANQIGGQAFMMMGTTRKMGQENALGFNIKGCRKYNYIKITLNAMDTYDVQFMKISPRKGITRDDHHEGIYNDMLKALIEKETGLYLSL